jgi:hypothetical protein
VNIRAWCNHISKEARHADAAQIKVCGHPGFPIQPWSTFHGCLHRIPLRTPALYIAIFRA